MATTAVAICNKALAHLGHTQQITAIDGTTAAGALCALFYDDARDGLLSEFDWPFARRHAVLTEDETVEHLLWDHAYALPAGCLTPRWISPSIRRVMPDDEIPFALEANAAGDGQILWCDVDPVADEAPLLRYTAQITTVTAFPLLFQDALAYRLAKELVPALPVKPELVGQISMAYEVALARALEHAGASERLDVAPETPSLAARR